MRTTIAAALAGTAALLGALPALAQNTQFTLLDTPYIHNTNSRAFSYFPLPPGVPDDWRSPVNYAEGTIHMRLEVLSKPSARDVNYQICIFQDQHTSAKHACARYQKFSAPGTYIWEQSLPSIFQYGNLDWSRRMLDTMLVVKDGAGNPVDDRFGFGGKWAGSPDFSLYYPMEVKFTAIVVAKGAAFAGWGNAGGSPPPATPPVPAPPPSSPGPSSGGNQGSVGEGENGDGSINDKCSCSIGGARPLRSALAALPFVLLFRRRRR